MNLLFEPAIGGARQFLFWRAVGEGVRHRHISEILEDGALHSQLVEICIQEGNDTLWIGRRAIEVHGAGWNYGLSVWAVAEEEDELTSTEIRRERREEDEEGKEQAQHSFIIRHG